MIRCMHAAALALALAVTSPVVESGVAWDRLLGDLLRRERQGPLAAARLIGITGVALHEAAASSPAGPRLSGFPGVKRPEAPIDAAVAMDAAASRLLRALFAERGRDALGAIGALEAQRLHAPPGDASRAHGEAVADAVAAWAGADGSQGKDGCAAARKRARRPGSWEPTHPQLRARPLGPCWGRLRPMALETCEVPLKAPPAYSEEPGSAFHAMALEVRDVVRRQDATEREIALFWSDDPGATGTPSGHWLAILDQLALERALGGEQYLRARLALGAALHDGSVACWRSKYEHDLLRPITYIQRNVDPSWVPLLPTPPFPEYPSGHAVLSGAAAVVLSAAIGDGAFVDRTRAERGHEPRRYGGFEAAAREAALSRLYGGIHFRPACDEGLAQGRAVGDQVVSRLLAPPGR